MQDTLLGKSLAYGDYQKNPFVKVIENGLYHHWLAIIMHGCQHRKIFVLDSKLNYSSSIQAKQQICTLLNWQNKFITVKFVPVQQQMVGMDCSLLAIAFIPYILAEKKIQLMFHFHNQVGGNMPRSVSKIIISLNISFGFSISDGSAVVGHGFVRRSSIRSTVKNNFPHVWTVGIGHRVLEKIFPTLCLGLVDCLVNFTTSVYLRETRRDKLDSGGRLLIFNLTLFVKLDQSTPFLCHRADLRMTGL